MVHVFIIYMRIPVAQVTYECDYHIGIYGISVQMGKGWLLCAV